MSNFNERLVLRQTLPSYNDGTIFVFEKVMNKLDHHAREEKFKEEQCNKRIKSLTDENEVLEIMLKHKSNEIAKLDKQFKNKMSQYSELRHERDLLEMQLQAEQRNSNRLNRDVEGLLSTNRTLLAQIDHLKSEHLEDMRKRLERTKRNY